MDMWWNHKAWDIKLPTKSRMLEKHSNKTKLTATNCLKANFIDALFDKTHLRMPRTVQKRNIDMKKCFRWTSICLL